MSSYRCYCWEANVEGKAGELIREHWQIIAILIGCFLIAAPMGTYTSWDAQLEYEAASNVLTHGFPYVTTGLMINQPPLGFYTAAPAFAILGLSYLNGVGLATVFGLGCVALVYALGTVLYGKKTGLLAAAIFGFIPWHVYMSRIFLIDNQYLFLSLLFLVVGILAVKRNSNRLVLGAGILFALALLTKLFAVFALIPLVILIFLYRKECAFKLNLRRILLFALPSLILQAVWFGGLANQNFFGVYFSSDFTHPVLVADPVLGFLPIIFVKSAGSFLFLAVFFSLGLAFVYRRQLAAHLRLDLICLGTIATIMALDMLFVFGFHLIVPYVSAIKYNYLALPFFCLLAASVADKGWALIGTMEWKKKIHFVKPLLIAFGLVLVLASLVESVLFLNAWVGFVAFGVDSVTYYGFNVYSDSMPKDTVVQWHLAGFILVIAALAVPFLAGLLRKSIPQKKSSS